MKIIKYIKIVFISFMFVLLANNACINSENNPLNSEQSLQVSLKFLKKYDIKQNFSKYSYKFKYYENKIILYPRKLISNDSILSINIKTIDGTNQVADIPLNFKKSDILPTDYKHFVINDLYFNNKIIIVLSQFKLYVFKKDEKNDFLLLKSIDFYYAKDKTYLTYTYIKKISNNLFALYNCSLHRYFKYRPKTFTYLSIVNIKNDSLIKNVEYFQNPTGLEWTAIRPRKLIDCNNNKIAIADANQYNIRIFDKKNNTEFKISRKIFHNKLDISGNLHYKTKEQIAYLYELSDSLNLISRINFINDSLLLVVWSSPDSLIDKSKYKFHFDIWKLKNADRKLIKSNMCLTLKKESDLLQDRDFFNPYQFIMVGDTIITETNDIPFNLKEIKGKSKKEYYDQLNKFYMQNDLILSFIFYKIY